MEASASRPAAFWPAFWMGVLLCLAKAAHWSRPPLSYVGLCDYATDLLVSSHADLLFVVGVGLLFGCALRLAAGRPRLACLIHASLVGLGVIAVAYAVASVQIFGFLRSPLTYPLLSIAGDMQSMRSSIGSFVTAGFAAASLGAPLVYLACLRATRTAALFRARPSRIAGVVVIAGWVLFARFTLAGPWGSRDDHLIARSPHFDILASYVDLLGGGRAVSFDEPATALDLRDFEAPPPRALALPAFPTKGAGPKNLLVIVMESTWGAPSRRLWEPLPHDAAPLGRSGPRSRLRPLLLPRRSHRQLSRGHQPFDLPVHHLARIHRRVSGLPRYDAREPVSGARLPHGLHRVRRSRLRQPARVPAEPWLRRGP